MYILTFIDIPCSECCLTAGKLYGLGHQSPDSSKLQALSSCMAQTAANFSVLIQWQPPFQGRCRMARETPVSSMH